MVSAALQTDASMLESKGFEAEQTEIPQDKQGETEFLSTLNIVHHVSPTLNATPSDGNHREYLHGQQREDTSLKVIIQFKKARAVRPKWEDVSPYARNARHFGLNGTSWSSMIKYYVRDGKSKVVPEPSTRSSSQRTRTGRH